MADGQNGSNLIDGDKDNRMIATVVELALEADSKGWQADDTKLLNKDCRIGIKYNHKQKPIYRIIIKNETDTTLQQMFDYLEPGYHNQLFGMSSLDARNIERIDSNHHIMHTTPITTEFQSLTHSAISDRDFMTMFTRFQIPNHKLLNGKTCTVIGTVEYDIPKTHVMYVEPQKHCIRAKIHCKGNVLYPLHENTGKQSDFMWVNIRYTTDYGGWTFSSMEDMFNRKGVQWDLDTMLQILQDARHELEYRNGSRSAVEDDQKQSFFKSNKDHLKVKGDKKENTDIPDCSNDNIENEVNEESHMFVEDEKTNYEKWDVMQRRRRIFEERTTSTELKLSVGKIADALVNSVATVASGGVLSAVLVAGLKDVVINCGWSKSSTEETITEQLFDGDDFIFLEIKKSSTSSKKGVTGFKKKKVIIKADTKYSYLKAGNDAARRELERIKRKQAKDVTSYIDGLPGWNDDE